LFRRFFGNTPGKTPAKGSERDSKGRGSPSPVGVLHNVPESDLIDELMLRWEAARQRGTAPRPEELCAEHPQLITQVRQRIHAVQTMERVLGVNHDDSKSTLPPTDFDGGPLPQIPGYEILRVVDQGGMGVVYEARQRDLGRTVAVKMISGMRLGPTQVARFRREAEASARLQHANFVQIFEVGQVNGRPFFSMEYVDGGSLAQLLARNRPSTRHAAELVSTLAQAIHTAHACGIVHRDLKPSNVMLTAEGTPKIGDFGLAKRLDDDSGRTRTGEVLGTPSYMAPEQATGQKELIGPATDVYALGAILYELLTSRPPFLGTSPLDTLRLVTSQEPIAPARLAPSTPPDLEAICLKCLEKTPAMRYPSARELAEDLRRFLTGQPVLARRIGKMQRAWRWLRRHPQGAALAVALVLLAVLPVIYLIGNDRAPSETERSAAQEAARIKRKAEQEAPLVREILQRNCFECHGQDPGKTKKNLNILDHKQLLNTERKIVVPGDPDHSRLIQRIADDSMPPEEEEARLPRVTQAELAILKDWVLGGAPPLPPFDPSTPPVVPYSALAAKAMGIFHENCYKCHKFDVAKNGIKILNYRLLVNVRKVVVPGKPDASDLYKLITSTEDNMRMPPSEEGPPLPPEAIATIRQWIQEGAPPFPKKK
jgi:mono/diheme cytochrome c family protein/predicted Ser/Thr protein kinase